MVGTSHLPLTPRPRRRRRIILGVVVACVAAVVLEVAAVTDGFGLGALLGPKGSSSSGGGGPNPYNENVTSVVGSITYSEKTDPFPQLDGQSLCSHCPLTPTIDANVTPAVAEVWVYFYLTYTGSNYTTISNFTVTTSGQNTSLFQLLGVFTGPYFSEPAPQLGFPPGAEYEVGLHLQAASIPYDGPTGYQLTFHVTSP